MTASLSKGEIVTDDAFLGGRLSVLQPAKGYRAGMDAVLLASATPAPESRPCRILDAGAGVGVVGLCIARRCPDADITLVEVAPELAGLARRNIQRNGLEHACRVVQADVALGGSLLNAAPHPDGLRPGTFDHVVANPPYLAEGRGTRAANDLRARSHAMPASDLDRWVAFMATAAAHRATLTMIHRADEIATILAALEGRFGGIHLLPIHSRAAEPANRILIWARKGSRAPLTLLPALVLHDATGNFLPQVERIFRDGAALPLTPYVAPA